MRTTITRYPSITAAPVLRGTRAGDSIGAVKARKLARYLGLSFVMALPAAASAQQRDIQQYSADDVEGRLMAFYSAALAFSPVGQIRVAPGSINVAIELSYVPPLTLAQRSAGYDKPEATNLAPVYPRPRVRFGLPRGIGIEGSWLPPVRVFGVTANLAAVALTAPVFSTGQYDITARASGMIGRVTGPITCNAEIAEADGSPALRTYYRSVCRDRDSKDYFEPRHLSGELLVLRGRGALQPYAGVGVRLDAGTRFDIGVARADGAYRDPDHPILELRAVRPQFMIGGTWRGFSRGSIAGEMFYAPGSVLTARALASVRLR